MSIRFEIIREYEVSKISDFFSFLHRRYLFVTELSINNDCEKQILLLNELEHDLQGQKEIYAKYVNYIAGLVINDTDPIYTNRALDFLGMCKDEIIGKIEKEGDEEDEDGSIGDFIKQNPEASKEDFFQFLKTKGFEIDDETFYITDKKGELCSSLLDYEDFVLGLFVKEYKDVLTIYKTVTNTENLVTCKEKPAEIEVKKMRKKFIEI